jgi:allophanate hydrolase
MHVDVIDLAIASLREHYRRADFTPGELIDALLDEIHGAGDNPVWITVLDRERLRSMAAGLDAHDPAALPLYGVPFAVKDNIDLAGVPTTAACPAYAYIPRTSAPVVERLMAAGAIPLGKTNLDQFATGLVGTRSPYGAVRNSFDPAYIAGGSSSGSAVAVALGQASFALGTDTAGSGRVPAAFNNLVGVKPTRGVVSTRGVVPACRSLDCVSLFALNGDDADTLLRVAVAADPEDVYSRPANFAPPPAGDVPFRFGVPQAGQLQFFGNGEYENLFYAAMAQLQRAGGTAVTVDLAPFLACARLLYEGPWVAERFAAIEAFIRERPEQLLPVTRAIIEPAQRATAVAAFQAEYRRRDLKRQADRVLALVDFVFTPTAGTIHTVAHVERDPIARNSELGYYTNFMNLLDLAALAVPAGFTAGGLPFGVTMFAPAHHDLRLLAFARRLMDGVPQRQGATAYTWQPREATPFTNDQYLPLAVCGAHLSGMVLNRQLTDRGGVLMEKTTTSPRYRFYVLAGGPPPRPGLVRATDGGGAIEVEVWGVPIQRVGSFLRAIPAPLGLGSIELADGRWVKGFICEGYAVDGACDITDLGSWRAFMAQPPG